MRMGRPAIKSLRLYRANTAANASGEQGTLRLPPLSHISLHCSLILGVWNMSRDMSEHIPKRSPFLAAGLAVGKRLDDGQLAPFLAHPCDLFCVSSPCHAFTTSHQPILSCFSFSHTPLNRAMLSCSNKPNNLHCLRHNPLPFLFFLLTFPFP